MTGSHVGRGSHHEPSSISPSFQAQRERERRYLIREEEEDEEVFLGLSVDFLKGDEEGCMSVPKSAPHPAPHPPPRARNTSCNGTNVCYSANSRIKRKRKKIATSLPFKMTCVTFMVAFSVQSKVRTLDFPSSQFY